MELIEYKKSDWWENQHSQMVWSFGVSEKSLRSTNFDSSSWV